MNGPRKRAHALMQRRRLNDKHSHRSQCVWRDDPTALSDAVSHWVLGFNLRILAHLNDRFPRPKELGR